MEWHVANSVSWYKIVAEDCRVRFPLAVFIKDCGNWLVTGLYEKTQETYSSQTRNKSLFRTTAFNKTNVMEFYDNYERTLISWNFTADRAYNIDATGVSTVVLYRNIVVQFGRKQAGQAVSGEGGNMFTLCMITIFVGNSVAAVFIFPRTILHDSLMFLAPPGSLGLVNIPQSSWIRRPLFLKVPDLTKYHTRSWKEDRIILQMDSHESHCILDSILYARQTVSR